MNEKDENVLVIRAASLKAAGYFEGFHPEMGRYLYLLKDNTSGYIPRSLAEKDEEYKQIVTYCVVKKGASAWCYIRGSKGGEERLHRLKSLGVGGHVSYTDRLNFNIQAAANPDMIAKAQGVPNIPTLSLAVSREIAEELDIVGHARFHSIGVINDDSNAVGRVHLGLVFLLDADSCVVQPRQDHLVDGRFRWLPQIVGERDSFETWSQLLIDGPLPSLLLGGTPDVVPGLLNNFPVMKNPDGGRLFVPRSFLPSGGAE